MSNNASNKIAAADITPGTRIWFSQMVARVTSAKTLDNGRVYIRGKFFENVAGDFHMATVKPDFYFTRVSAAAVQAVG